MKQNCKRSCDVCGGKLKKLHLKNLFFRMSCTFKLCSYLNPRNRMVWKKNPYPLGLDCGRGNSLRFIVRTDRFIVCPKQFIVFTQGNIAIAWFRAQDAKGGGLCAGPATLPRKKIKSCYRNPTALCAT